MSNSVKNTKNTKAEAKAQVKEVKKATVKVPALPKKMPKTIEALADYLTELHSVDGFALRTWEKIPNCYSIKFNGKIIGEFYLSPKKGLFRISTRSAYFTQVPSNSTIIKNGLDLNVSKCTETETAVAFIRNVANQIAAKANGKDIVKYSEDNFRVEAEQEEEAAEA